jgi:hypothetical protein
MASESSATEKKHSKGKQHEGSDKATIESRVSQLYEMRSHGHTKQSAWRKVTVELGWACSPRTFDRLWARVTELLKETWAVDRETIFLECLDGLRSAHAMAMEQRNPSAAQACVMSIARLSCVDPTQPTSQLYGDRSSGRR